jgi:TOTE conflict system primase-like protein
MKHFELFFRPEDERFALQSDDGNYYKQDSKVDEQLFEKHLQGTSTLGAYTTFQNTCIFGAWDIDINKEFYSLFKDPIKAFEHYKSDIIEILKQFHILLQGTHHYFEFSGRKGAHVWVFFDKPVDSEIVYDFLKEIRSQIKFNKKIFHIELFPKQATTDGDGNLIKLPLATHRVTGKQSFWCDPFLEPIDLKFEEIQKNPASNFSKSVKPATKAKSVIQNSQPITSTSEGLKRLENRCVALKNAPKNNASSNDWRVFVGAVFCRLGLGDKVHEYIYNYGPDYDQQKTEYHLQNMIANMPSKKPITCRFASEKGFCTLECRTRTPFDHLENHYPMFLDEVQSTANTYVTTSTNQPLFSLTTASANLNSQMQKLYSAEVIPQAKQAIQTYLDVFKMNDQNTAGKAIVLNTVPGGFKTIATIEMIVNAIKEDTHFGAVIAVERNADVKRIANEINSRFFLLQKNSAYAFYGFDPENPGECILGHRSYKPGMCNKKNCQIPLSKCRVKMNNIRQQNYRVIVMSHQRLKMYSQVGEMNRFRQWGFSYSIKRRRTHLIIDEQPPLLELMRFDTDTLNEFTKVLPQLDNGKVYVQSLSQPVGDLISFMQNNSEARSIIQTKQVPQFKFDATFEHAWKDFTFDKASINYLPIALETAYEYGGIFVKQNLNGQPEISTGYYLNNSWDFDRTIILDGTADISQKYKPGLFDKVFVPQLHNYEHLTFYHYTRFNLSRTTYYKTDDLIVNLAEDIKEIAKYRDKVYVVVYKENKEEYEKLLANEIQQTKVIIRTLGSTRGDNSMRECDTIVFTGLIHKGEMNYLNESLVLNRDYSMDLNVRKHRKVRKFNNRETEVVKLSSMLEELVQEVYRTRLRSHNLKQDVHAYIIVSDDDFLNLIEGYFAGCKMEEWYPVETSYDKLNITAKNLIATIESHLAKGNESVKKGSIDIDPKILTQTLKRYPEIKEILDTKGIEITTRTFKLKNPSISI